MQAERNRHNGGMKGGGRRYTLLADEDLMSLIEREDAAAFAAIYDRHNRAANSLAYRVMGGRQAAEDLVQDAFLKVWRSAGAYRAERGSVRTWVLAVVQNVGRDGLRSAATRRRTRDKAEAEIPRSHPCEAFSEAWRNARQEQVREALAALPPEQLEVLELAHFFGNTHVEIAEILELPLGTVKGRTRLGLKKIRDHFEPRNTAMSV